MRWAARQRALHRMKRGELDGAVLQQKLKAAVDAGEEEQQRADDKKGGQDRELPLYVVPCAKVTRPLDLEHASGCCFRLFEDMLLVPPA